MMPFSVASSDGPEYSVCAKYMPRNIWLLKVQYNT